MEEIKKKLKKQKVKAAKEVNNWVSSM